MSKEHSKLLLRSTNELLNYLSLLPNIPCGLPSTNALMDHLNISRTTTNKLIDIICNKGIARQDGKNKIVLRKPIATDYYSTEEIESSKSDIIEKQILKKLSSYELKPGDRFSELEISKKLKSNTIIVREALFKIAQSGIIRKHPRQKWEVVEFSLPMITEITEIRKLYESYAIQEIKGLPENDPIWNTFKNLLSKHKSLLSNQPVKAKDMREIERAFHTTIVQASNNRFIKKSYNSIFSLIFFHLWQIEYDQQKIEKVLKQHLEILEALLEKNFNKAKSAMILHLDHAKLSMNAVNERVSI